MKGIRLESFAKCDFIPVDYFEVRQVKSSFKKLMRACVPSAPYTDPEKGYLRAIEDSDWLSQIQGIMQIAGAATDLLDVQGSSVMMCLEDGWDFTTQVGHSGHFSAKQISNFKLSEYLVYVAFYCILFIHYNRIEDLYSTLFKN